MSIVSPNTKDYAKNARLAVVQKEYLSGTMQRRTIRQGLAWCLVFLVWTLGAESQAQREQGIFQGGAIREEDLPADPRPFRPPRPSDQALQGQGTPPPTRRWLPFFKERDAGPPPTLLEPPTLPLHRQTEEEVDGIESRDEVLSKEKTKKTKTKKKNKKAEQDKEDALSLSPHDLVALGFVEEGEGVLEGGDVERARMLFEQAVEVAPFQPYSYYFLGRISFSQGKLKQALAFLYKAELLLAKNNKEWLGETTCLRGLVAEDSGDFEQARSAYERCSSHTPRNLRALTALTRLAEELPEPEPVYPQTLPQTLPRTRTRTLERTLPRTLPQTNVFPTQPNRSDRIGNRDIVR